MNHEHENFEKKQSRLKMPIHKKERKIQSLMGEVCVEVIPLRFVKKVYVLMENSTTKVFSSDYWENSNYEIVEDFIKGQTFDTKVMDVRIEMDMEKVKENIDADYFELLKQIHDSSSS